MKYMCTVKLQCDHTILKLQGDHTFFKLKGNLKGDHTMFKLQGDMDTCTVFNLNELVGSCFSLTS